VAFHPYLNFGGNCREAFDDYQHILGGELSLLTMAEMPGGHPVPPDQAELIMHAALVHDGGLLMGADDPTGSFDGVRGFHVNHQVADVEGAERVFAALADGGRITMPMGETFFASRFGMCVDRFGIPWMIMTALDGTGTDR
jgi:PhnB protein